MPQPAPNLISEFTDDEALAQIVFDLADRRRRGEAADLDSAMRAHPQYAADLQRLFPTIDALAELDAVASNQGGEVACTMNLSADGSRLATGNRQGRIDVWDTATWRRRRLLETAGEVIESLAFVPGTETALVVSTPQHTFVVAEDSGQSFPIPAETLGKASVVVFSPDGRMAALLMRPSENLPRLQLWDLRSGERLLAGEGQSMCVVFSSDSRRFAAGGGDGTIRLWQTDNWDKPLLLVGHGRRVLTLAISPDGRTVASAADDLSIKLWHAATGRELLTFETRLHSADCLRFARHGSALAISGTGGANYSGPQVVVWPTDSGW
ncbi:MAG TPA: WD40 repeat domain-containing protein [Planctomycetaceae bacterium]|jgi:WD40 repeat protein